MGHHGYPPGDPRNPPELTAFQKAWQISLFVVFACAAGVAWGLGMASVVEDIFR